MFTFAWGWGCKMRKPQQSWSRGGGVYTVVVLVALSVGHHQHTTETKAVANTWTPSSKGTKSWKKQGGFCTKVLRDPGPLPSFVQKNGVFLEQLRLSCMGHLSPGPFIREKDWNSPAGERSRGRVCITLCLINVELTPHSCGGRGEWWWWAFRGGGGSL